MLLIISDLHLGDGTTAKSISPTAFHLFGNRLRETAYFASFRRDGTYRPIEDIDLVIMGDVLDPLHSTRWLDTQPGDVNYTRPWTDSANPNYAAKLSEVTRAIMEENKESLDVLKSAANGEVVDIPPADGKGKPVPHSKERIPLKVRIHYTVGNHDWYYILKGNAFDQIRKEMIDTMGLSNPISVFPHEIHEYPPLEEIFRQYKVFGRHGDCYDKFNFDREKGRAHSTLGDVFAMEVLNRFPVEVQKRHGDDLPIEIVDGLRKLTNVRPALATPLWIGSQIKRHARSETLEEELKQVWDDICDEFLQVDFVREQDKAFQFDIVDAMQLIIKISDRASFTTINDIVTWLKDKMWGGEISYTNHAIHEPELMNGNADYVVYGHTHHPEIVPLDTGTGNDRMYLNSGTWHSYYGLAMKNPAEQKFVPYQMLTYLTFYKDDEREGHRFESWSGAYA